MRTEDALQFYDQNAPMQQAGNQQAQSGSLGSGAAPVQVNLPLDGRQFTFEKLLVLDEPLTASFSYKGLKKD